MSKIVLLESVAKQYLSLKFAGRRNQKIVSSVKFATVFLLLIWVVAFYAFTITQASTSGYFLEEVKSELEELQFAKSVQELEVIKKEKALRNNMNLQYSNSWFAWHGSNMVTVNTYQAYVANQEWDGVN